MKKRAVFDLRALHIEFQKRRDAERLAALDRLAREAFDAGLYERNVFPQDGRDE